MVNNGKFLAHGWLGMGNPVLSKRPPRRAQVVMYHEHIGGLVIPPCCKRSRLGTWLHGKLHKTMRQFKELPCPGIFTLFAEITFCCGFAWHSRDTVGESEFHRKWSSAKQTILYPYMSYRETPAGFPRRNWKIIKNLSLESSNIEPSFLTVSSLSMFSLLLRTRIAHFHEVLPITNHGCFLIGTQVRGRWQVYIELWCSFQISMVFICWLLCYSVVNMSSYINWNIPIKRNQQLVALT